MKSRELLLSIVLSLIMVLGVALFPNYEFLPNSVIVKNI